MTVRHSSSLALLLALAAGGCATSPAATPAPATPGSTTSPATDQSAADNIMSVTVSHNRADGGTTTIYVDPSAGVRVALGTIDLGVTKSFTYRIEAQNRQVQLIAIDSNGRTLKSELITVPRGARLSWDLQINSLRVRR